MIVCQFTRAGDPVPKGRPRFVRATGRTYTPAATMAYEAEIALLARVASVKRTPTLADTFRLDLAFRRSDARRVDLDNCIKAIEDSINAAGVWVDDFQVVEIRATIERRSKNPGVDVCVTLL